MNEDRKQSAFLTRAPSSSSAEDYEEGPSPGPSDSRQHPPRGRTSSSSFPRSPTSNLVRGGVLAAPVLPSVLAATPPRTMGRSGDPLTMMGSAGASLRSPGSASSGRRLLSTSSAQPSEEQLMRQAHILQQRQQQLESMLATASTGVRAPSLPPNTELALLQQQCMNAALDQQLLQHQHAALLQQHARFPVSSMPVVPPLSPFLLGDPSIQQHSAGVASMPSSSSSSSRVADVSEAAFRRGNGVMDRSEVDRIETADSEELAQVGDTATPKVGPSGEVFEAFPQKLHRMIMEAERDKKDDIISFFPHGRAFVIHKPRAFVSEIMPKYFTTTRMSSFQRQLNLYGFRRITEGQDMGGYGHKYFMKSRPDLCAKIKRKQYSKNNRLVRPREPNFYSMPPMLQGGFPSAGGAVAGMGGLAAAAAAMDSRMAAAAASLTGGNDLLNNSLMMQNGAQLLSLQHEAALMQQEKANMLALASMQQQREQQQQQQQQDDEKEDEE